MVNLFKKKTKDINGDTVLDRKGKVDGSSLLDGNGEPTSGTLFNVEYEKQKKMNKKAGDENSPPQDHPGNMPVSHQYPAVEAQYPPGSYPPHQQHMQYPTQAYPPPPPHPTHVHALKKKSFSGRVLSKLPKLGKKKAAGTP